MNDNEKYAITVMLDDITFMLFDLERGGFLTQEDTILFDDGFNISYKRDLISEVIVDGWKNIISNFYISATKNDIEFLRFETHGADRKFTLHNFEGFVVGMLINKIEQYRKMKFSINN